jgi:hypothetical protein
MENKTDNSMYRVGDIVIGSSDPSKSVYSITGTKVNPEGVSLFGSDEALTARAKDLARSAVMAGGIPLPVNQGDSKNNQTKKAKKKLTKTNKTAPFSIESYVSNVSHEHEIGNYVNYTPPYSAPYTPEPERTYSVVQFENDFGKIKSKVENIVEHELAFMLVYSDEDAMVFEPKVGELLAIHTPDKQRIEVYYPGVTFDSPDNTKKFMILFKVPAENQE